MAQYKIEINQRFPAPVAQVFNDLGNHQTLGKILGAPISVTKTDADGGHGVGSVRLIHLGPLPIVEETVTELIPNQLIEYTVTQYSPIKNHLGRLVFTEENGETHLNYIIVMESVIPFTTKAISEGLKAAISFSLKRYANSLKTQVAAA